MSEVFLRIVNMSISAGWLILAVLVLRFVLKKAPKWVNVLLWGVVAVRLVCPFSIESALSLIPSAETIPLNIGMDTTPTIHSGISTINSAINPMIGQANTPAPGASINPLQITIAIYANIWVLGILAMLIYTGISYLALRRKLRTAVILRDNLFQCETVRSPFVLGILKPRIYLPYAMDGENLKHVIAHEQAHIRRKDHWWKPLGFLLLTIHWFNPLMWVAYILFCRDIELACDEKVIAELGNEQRADYTQALVACSINRRTIAACPLAFGEVGVKERVKSIMNYRKPTFWIIVAAIVVCGVVAVCFLTNPAGNTLTKLDIDEVNMSVALKDIQSMTVQYYGDIIQCNTADINRFLSTMDKIKIRNYPVSQSRDEGRDKSFSIAVNENLVLNFNEDFSEIWIDNGVRPSLSYPIANPEIAEELLLDFHFARNGVGTTVTKWFDCIDSPDDMPSDAHLEITLPEFPDVTFIWYPRTMEAVVGEDHVQLFSGMPIWNTYLCDVTGDGIRDICANYTFGSGIVDTRVIVYDYANGASYELADRGTYDYILRYDEVADQLIVEKRINPFGELVSAGRLVYKDGSILIEQTDIRASLVMVPTDTDLKGLHAGALLLPIDGNTYRYDLTDNAPEDVTADELLYTFKEADLQKSIDWEVYSLKEYPYKSFVLLISDTNGAWLCRYSPPGRCSNAALANAINAGYVVMEDGIATHGQDVWKEFYDQTQKGETARVIVAHYGTLDPNRCDSVYYQVFNQDYPYLNVYMLTYNGEIFTLSYGDLNAHQMRTYEYLMKYDTTDFYSMSSKLPEERYDYVLTHDNKVTWEQLFNGLVSSQMDAYIDHYSIYSEYK